MTYWRTYYHLIWATKNRLPLIIEPRDELLKQALHVKARDLGAFIHAIGTMPDHIHIAISIPPAIAVADVIRHCKGSSARLLNKDATSAELGWFGWQNEYGVHTFGARSLPSIIAYLENQAAHHARDDLWPLFEQLPAIPAPDQFTIADSPD